MTIQNKKPFELVTFEITNGIMTLQDQNHYELHKTCVSEKTFWNKTFQYENSFE